MELKRPFFNNKAMEVSRQQASDGTFREILTVSGSPSAKGEPFEAFELFRRAGYRR